MNFLSALTFVISLYAGSVFTQEVTMVKVPKQISIKVGNSYKLPILIVLQYRL